MIDFLISLVDFCVADKVGVEVDTTPHIYFEKGSEEESGIGKEAEFIVYIISHTENEGNGLYEQLKQKIVKGAYSSFYIYKVEFNPDGRKLPDNRWMQEIKLKILYEEA